MALREIRHYHRDPCLRMKSKPVDRFDDKLRLLIEDMVDTMYHEDGVGLAAPQIGILKRVIVMDVGEGPIVLINPEFLSQIGEQEESEGCLSVPGLRGIVKRPAQVKVKAQSPDGGEVVMEGDGLLARAICHEIDHLDGVLFIDKIVPGTLEG